ncbi:hypothetical protein [Enterobacter hormaechei]|uniref:hypothetical protein n=1 Tax=Enterobacter hormaechei TaxID=158836 RepID=UPI001E2B9F5E|nr:hypothetical protein [Enterobacter hormaechei]MCC4525053.1 hypothetical protein [Enterobacter hormaechei]MCC4529138.1 hypothetical protein [Enterobacter hormaechei]MCC4534380.1 hypothetical protein [Enterobacter hormaechei]MCC4538756.1 hypothetical protein [Enterobacter hormaechei]
MNHLKTFVQDNVKHTLSTQGVKGEFEFTTELRQVTNDNGTFWVMDCYTTLEGKRVRKSIPLSDSLLGEDKVALEPFTVVI